MIGNLMEKQPDGSFYSPGDLVTLRQNLSNKPDMVVKSIDKVSGSTSADKPKLLGITCSWFNTNHELQSARFSTKDLKHIE